MLDVSNFSNKKMMTTVAVCIMKLLSLAHHPVTILSATSLQPAIHVGGSSLVSRACSFLHRKCLLLPALPSLARLLDVHTSPFEWLFSGLPPLNDDFHPLFIY